MRSQQSQESNPVGRPLKFKTVAELERAISSYFDLCDPHTQRRVVDCGINEKGETIWREREVMTDQQPYTVSGLALALGISRQTFLNYEERDEFVDSIVMARQRCEAYAEGQLYGPYANGAKFNLINNYRGKHQDWSDRQVLAGDPDAPLANPYAQLDAAALRRLAGASGDEPTDQEAGDDSTDSGTDQA